MNRPGSVSITKAACTSSSKASRWRRITAPSSAVATRTAPG
nr:MAG TPA: hypothetical protein [Caudoviricetes sp.]